MFAAIAFALHAGWSPIYFRQAKARADANEAHLGHAMHARLYKEQRKALDAAMKTCARPDSNLSRFTVVVSLNANGSVASSWLKGDTKLARCVRMHLIGSGLPGHWPTPFYTSFVVSLKRH